MTQKHNWPDMPIIEPNELPVCAELKKLLYQARLEVCKAQQQAAIDIQKARRLAAVEAKTSEEAVNVEREKAAYANEYSLSAAIYNAYIEVAKQQVSAPGTKADFVQKAATAISAAYIAVVGLSFGVGEHARVLPFSGLLPTIFLGLAVFLATAYTGYVTNPGSMEETVAEGSLTGRQFERRKNFIIWTQSAALLRKRWLQTAIISLGIGVLFLPAPYIQIDVPGVLILAVVGILCTILIPMAIEN